MFKASIFIAAVFLPLIVYVLTLAREITFTDSGELAAAAATLGIAHPPGYPLFVLTGRLFALLPVGSVAFRVGLVSAAAAALTSFVIYLAGSRLLQGILSAKPSVEPTAKTTAKTTALPKAQGAHAPVESLALVLAPLSGALLFAFAGTVWSQAVVVEVYTLQALLVSVFLLVCITALYESREVRGVSRYWPVVGFSFGLALTNHPTSVLLLPSLVILLVLSLVRHHRVTPRQPIPYWRTLGATILPLLLYFLLPLRSRMSPDVNWSYPDTWHRLLVHVTARQFHGQVGREGLQFAELGRFLKDQLTGEATWVFVILALVGLAAILWKVRGIGIVLLAAALAHLLYNMFYPIHDIRLYYIPLLAIMGMWAACGAGVLAWLAMRRHGKAGLVVAVILCLTCLVPLIQHWRQNDQHNFKLLAHYVRDTLKHVDPNAIVFSGRWDNFSSPALYYQKVEGFRSDVVVLDMGFLASPVLARRLSTEAPDLVAACQQELSSIAEMARLSEMGQTYNVSVARRRFQDFQRKLLIEAVRLRPTYVTSDLFRHPMVAGFNLITEGLVARVAEVDEFRPLVMELEGPGITRDEIRDQRERNIYSDYVLMLHNRAQYLERQGKTAEAAELIQQADRLMLQ